MLLLLFSCAFCFAVFACELSIHWIPDQVWDDNKNELIARCNTDWVFGGNESEFIARYTPNRVLDGNKNI
jgi:hypothetical protein